MLQGEVSRGVWCVTRNFNVVLRSTKRKIVSVGSQEVGLIESLEFEEFIKAMGLVNLALWDRIST